MTTFQGLILGMVQGLTEFLPISSSGHLVLVPWILGWRLNPQAAFVFDVLVQWGTLLGVLVYFRRDLWMLLVAALDGIYRRRPFAEPGSRLAWLLLLASFPAALAGLILKDLVADAFSDPMAVSVFLLLTASFLGISEWIGRRWRASCVAKVKVESHVAGDPWDGLRQLSLLDAVLIGCGQALALFPGISRSGSTIAAGLALGLRRDQAARFSFLMAVPIMLGAGSIALLDLARTPDAAALIPSLLVGFIAAALVGYLSIHWLLRYLASRSLLPFAVYCALVGLSGLLLGSLA